MRIYDRGFRAEDVNGRPIAGAHVTLWETNGTQITTGIEDLTGAAIAGGVLVCDTWGYAPSFRDTEDRPDIWAIGSDTGEIPGVERVHLEPDDTDERLTAFVASVGAIGGPAGPLDGSGLIPSAQIPGGGGGGGVSIGGDLGGTTSSPQVIGTHLGSPLPLAQGGTAAASASAARTSLGLGGAAILSVGSTAGTVAAGDDSRIIGAAQKASNLSDLASAGTARTNLGLGGAALLNVGATAGTVAAGDDSRIAGAAQKASNLSDLASASTARTNLGLGGAALLSVGATAGTVAAGDDSRLTNARTPTAHASSHAIAGSDRVTPAAIGAATDHGYSPADYSLLAWVADPGYIAGVVPPSTGIVHLLKVKVPAAITINNIVIQVSGSGTTLTSGQNFAALFDTSGNRLGITADQSAAWATNGSKVCALTAPVSVSAGYVYVGLLWNGTTIPNMGRFAVSTQFNNANLPLTGLRFAQYSSGLTAMPSSITMASIVIDAVGAFWAGVS